MGVRPWFFGLVALAFAILLSSLLTIGLGASHSTVATGRIVLDGQCVGGDVELGQFPRAVGAQVQLKSTRRADFQSVPPLFPHTSDDASDFKEAAIISPQRVLTDRCFFSTTPSELSFEHGESPDTQPSCPFYVLRGSVDSMEALHRSDVVVLKVATTVGYIHKFARALHSWTCLATACNSASGANASSSPGSGVPVLLHVGKPSLNGRPGHFAKAVAVRRVMDVLPSVKVVWQTDFDVHVDPLGLRPLHPTGGEGAPSARPAACELLRRWGLSAFDHGAALVMQDEELLNNGFVGYVRGQDCSDFLISWWREGKEAYVSTHTFDQTAFLHLLMSAWNGTNGFVYRDSFACNRASVKARPNCQRAAMRASGVSWPYALQPLRNPPALSGWAPAGDTPAHVPAAKAGYPAIVSAASVGGGAAHAVVSSSDYPTLPSAAVSSSPAVGSDGVEYRPRAWRGVYFTPSATVASKAVPLLQKCLWWDCVPAPALTVHSSFRYGRIVNNIPTC